MQNITRASSNIDQVLSARVEEVSTQLDSLYANHSGSYGDWMDAFHLKMDLANATAMRDQNFVIQHHLAKTILSTT